MRADRDDGDRSVFRVLLEQGAELFAAHPGHIKIDDDEINAHRTMDLKHFISRGRGENTNVRAVQKTVLFFQDRVNGMGYYDFLSWSDCRVRSNSGFCWYVHAR
jgi:hypothetical protein